MIVTFCKEQDLDKDIKIGERGGLELTYYCPICETEYVDDGKGGITRVVNDGGGRVK